MVIGKAAGGVRHVNNEAGGMKCKAHHANVGCLLPRRKLNRAPVGRALSGRGRRVMKRS